jgi:CheY-like chemotaxis protein
VADKQTILVVEDDPNLAEMLISFLNIQGYEVLTTDWGEKAIKVCQAHLPSIALLDVRLPDIDGYEVAHRLRSQRRTQNIPIIFLTERNDRSDRIRGLELGAVDYIAKPFDLHELVLRVRNVLHRTEMPSPTNSITGLPEGALVDERLSNLLQAAGWAVVSVSLHGLAPFRARYGFMDADNAVRVVAQLLKEASQKGTPEPDFIGHLDTEHLILITSHSRAPIVQKHLDQRLAEFMENIYPLQDRLNTQLPSDRLTTTLGVATQTAPALANLTALKHAVLNSLSS